MRFLRDGEIRAVRLGDHGGLVFLDGEQLNGVIEIERISETWKVEADRLQWKDAE